MLEPVVQSRYPRVTLPLRTAAAPETILLVDDELAVRAIVQEILEAGGYTVLAARDAAEAVAIEQDLAWDIHLLLTDVMMPGLSGPDLARQLRPHRPRMKVLYMSGFTARHFATHNIDLAGAPILAKPFRLDVLLTNVRDILVPTPSNLH